MLNKPFWYFTAVESQQKYHILLQAIKEYIIIFGRLSGLSNISQ